MGKEPRKKYPTLKSATYDELVNELKARSFAFVFCAERPAPNDPMSTQYRWDGVGTPATQIGLVQYLDRMIDEKIFALDGDDDDGK